MARTYIFGTSPHREHLCTFRFPFKDGTCFWTNATEEKYAVSNFLSYFSDMDIKKRGGLTIALPKKEEEEKKDEEPKEMLYTTREICGLCGIATHILYRMVDCGCVYRDENGKYARDAIQDVHNCLAEKAKNPHYYMERYAVERRKRLWMTGR